MKLCSILIVLFSIVIIDVIGKTETQKNFKMIVSGRNIIQHLDGKFSLKVRYEGNYLIVSNGTDLIQIDTTGKPFVIEMDESKQELYNCSDPVYNLLLLKCTGKFRLREPTAKELEELNHKELRGPSSKELKKY